MAANDCWLTLLIFRIGVPLIALVSCVGGATKTVRLAEGGSIQVTCPRTPPGIVLATSFVKKLNGRYVTLFTRRNTVSFERGNTGEDQVSLDESTMTMTVYKLTIRDNGAVFMCKMFSTVQEAHNSIIVTVTVPPEIEFNVSPAPPYNDRTVITVTCTVNRVSPTLKAGGMSLSVVGETFKEVKVTRNQDNTYRYVVTRRHMITKKDDNKEANCKVVTSRGKHHKKSVLVRLVRPPTGKPKLSSSKTVLHPGDSLRLTCNLARKGIPRAHQYTWYKNGRAFKNTSAATYTQKVASSASAGSFSCRALNTEGASEVSAGRCIAFTKEHQQGSPIAVWVSVLSFLLNIAAVVFVVMVHIKPRVDKFLADRKRKSSKTPSEDEDKKDTPEVDSTDLQKQADSELDPTGGVPNRLVHPHDQVGDDEKKHPEQLIAQAPSSGKPGDELNEQLAEQLKSDGLPEADTPPDTADIRL